MGKHKSKKILNKAINALFAIELAFGSYMLHNIFQSNAKYVAGNGFPSAMVSKTAISPKIYETAIWDKLLFHLPEPSAELISGLDIDTIILEADLLGQNASSLEEYCVSQGLISKGEMLSQEELSEKADMIFEELNAYFGTNKNMPHIKWKLDEENEDLGATYRPGIKQITIFKPQDSFYVVENLTHELSHSWFINESLNELSAVDMLIRLAERYGEQYMKDNSDKSSGRDACLYGMAASNNLANDWIVIYGYLEIPDLSSNTQIYHSLLEYYLLPGLMVRYVAFNDSVEEPVIDTTKRYSIDLSATQGFIETILSEDGPVSQFPFFH